MSKLKQLSAVTLQEQLYLELLEGIKKVNINQARESPLKCS